MAHWQTSWNHKRYDYKRLIEDFKAGRTLEVKNSKGMAKMKVVPHIGDTVVVSCNKKKIMKCSVISEFEEEEKVDLGYEVDEEQLDKLLEEFGDELQTMITNICETMEMEKSEVCDLLCAAIEKKCNEEEDGENFNGQE